jgi:hypothetical protein
MPQDGHDASPSAIVAPHRGHSMVRPSCGCSGAESGLSAGDMPLQGLSIDIGGSSAVLETNRVSIFPTRPLNFAIFEKHAQIKPMVAETPSEGQKAAELLYGGISSV